MYFSRRRRRFCLRLNLPDDVLRSRVSAESARASGFPFRSRSVWQINIDSSVHIYIMRIVNRPCVTVRSQDYIYYVQLAYGENLLNLKTAHNLYYFSYMYNKLYIDMSEDIFIPYVRIIVLKSGSFYKNIK